MKVYTYAIRYPLYNCYIFGLTGSIISSLHSDIWIFGVLVISLSLKLKVISMLQSEYFIEP